MNCHFCRTTGFAPETLAVEWIKDIANIEGVPAKYKDSSVKAIFYACIASICQDIANKNNIVLLLGMFSEKF